MSAAADKRSDVAQPHCTRAWYMRPPVWVLGIVLVALAVFGIMQTINRPASISYGEFLDQLDDGNVASVTFKGTQIDGSFKKPVGQAAAKGAEPQTAFRSAVPDFGDPALLPALREHHVVIDVVSSSTWVSWLGRLPWPMVLIIGGVLIAGLVRLMRGDKSAGGSPVPTHPMMGLIAGLFGKHDEPAAPPAAGSSNVPPKA